MRQCYVVVQCLGSVRTYFDDTERGYLEALRHVDAWGDSQTQIWRVAGSSTTRVWPKPSISPETLPNNLLFGIDNWVLGKEV